MIAYFSDLSTKLKASTLRSNYSILSATLSTKEEIDILKYSKHQDYKYKSKFYQINNLKSLLLGTFRM